MRRGSLEASSFYAVIHQNTNPANFSEERLVLLKGQVRDDVGMPLEGVKVFAPDQPNLGYQKTNRNGDYTFAVNGGGVLTLRYSKEAYILSERTTRLRWQEIIALNVLFLKKHSSKVSPLVRDSSTAQVVRGEEIQDNSGKRQATLIVNPNTKAQLELADGSLIDASSLRIRPFTTQGYKRRHLECQKPT